MKKYFYTDGTTSFGPFDLEELRQENIQRKTLVWFQGMKDWAAAETVPELGELFELVPPSIKKEPAAEQPPAAQRPVRKKPPKTWLVESILATFFCCMPFGIVGIVHAAKVESRFYAGDYEAADRASADARRWTLISFWTGISLTVLYILFYVIVILTGVISSWGFESDLFTNI